MKPYYNRKTRTWVWKLRPCKYIGLRVNPDRVALPIAVHHYWYGLKRDPRETCWEISLFCLHVTIDHIGANLRDGTWPYSRV